MEVPTPNLSPGRTSSDSNSPEFEFWMLRNPSLPPPTLLSAAELFSGGVLLPLRHLNQSNHEPDPPEPSISETPVSDPKPGPDIANSSPLLTRSRRWKDLFKKSSDKKIENKEKKREKLSQLGPVPGTELNINIWPFSRSRSAGNCGTRPRMSSAGGGRKASSAPCSRSNSAGESKSRKWPSSPVRTGVHLGRSSPVWQVRPTGPNSKPPLRNAGKLSAPRRHKDTGAQGTVLNLKVSTCIGYRNNLSCRSDGDCDTRAGGRSSSGTIFNIRNIFGKKVY